MAKSDDIEWREMLQTHGLILGPLAIIHHDYLVALTSPEPTMKRIEAVLGKVKEREKVRVSMTAHHNGIGSPPNHDLPSTAIFVWCQFLISYRCKENSSNTPRTRANKCILEPSITV